MFGGCLVLFSRSFNYTVDCLLFLSMNPATDLQRLEACRFLDDGERLERNSDYLLWQKSKVTKRIGKSNQHAKQSYWKVKPACKAVQTTHIPIHLGTLSMTPKVEFKVYPHVSHVSHVRVSKRLMGYSQPSQAFFCSVGFSILITITINTARHRISPLRQAVCHFQGRLSAENAAQHADMVIYQQPNATNHRLINSWVQQTTPWPKTVRLFRGTQR